jgi:hypothetical protein
MNVCTSPSSAEAASVMLGPPIEPFADIANVASKQVLPTHASSVENSMKISLLSAVISSSELKSAVPEAWPSEAHADRRCPRRQTWSRTLLLRSWCSPARFSMIARCEPLHCGIEDLLTELASIVPVAFVTPVVTSATCSSGSLGSQSGRLLPQPTATRVRADEAKKVVS